MGNISASFLWRETGEPDYWAKAHMSSYEYLLDWPEKKEVAWMNKVGDIIVPKYKEAKWMANARLDYMEKARDGILSGFDWSATEQGFDYWNEVHTKLFVMCEHMKIYSVIRRLTNEG